MPRKVPTITVVLHREGKQVIPEIGKAFDFTKDEFEEIESMRKGSLRDPKNEDPDAGKPQNARAAKAAEDKAADKADDKAASKNDI